VFYVLVDIIGYLISIIVALVIGQFVLSLLLQFRVIDGHNPLVASISNALNALLEPLLKPIRRLMPDTGMIDFSPMVLIILLTVLQKLLLGMAMTSGA